MSKKGFSSFDWKVTPWRVVLTLMCAFVMSEVPLRDPEKLENWAYSDAIKVSKEKNSASVVK